MPGRRSVGSVTSTTQAAPSRAASRRAAQKMAERADEFARRESELREVVTAFHAAVEHGEKVRADAEAKAAKLLADAEAKAAAVRQKAQQDAACHDEQAAVSARRMLDLGESREAVVALTDWPVVRIREIQRATVLAVGAGPRPSRDGRHRPGRPWPRRRCCRPRRSA